MNCNIVRDLIPLCIDGCCSEESVKVVEEHIKVCNECKKLFEDMNVPSDMVMISNAPNEMNLFDLFDVNDFAEIPEILSALLLLNGTGILLTVFILHFIQDTLKPIRKDVGQRVRYTV